MFRSCVVRVGETTVHMVDLAGVIDFTPNTSRLCPMVDGGDGILYDPVVYGVQEFLLGRRWSDIVLRGCLVRARWLQFLVDQLFGVAR